MKAKFRLVQTISRFAETKFRFVEAKLRSNDTKFRNETSPHAAKFRFDYSPWLRNFADIRTIEAPKFRRFFVWSESSQFDCRNSRNFAYFGKFRLHFFFTVLYMIFLAFLVDSSPEKHNNSSLEAVERILFATTKHCLKSKSKKRYTCTRLSSVSLTKNGLTKNVVLRDTNCGNLPI